MMDDLGVLATNLISKLRNSQTLLVTVESCTGGLIAQSITDISGASDVFWGGFVTYDNSAKEFLGVNSSLIKSKGAVSAEVAEAMATKGLESMIRACKASQERWRSMPRQWICVSTTGIAGPGGGTKEKPVGSCFLALSTALEGSSSPEVVCSVQELHAPANFTRNDNRLFFAKKAFELLVMI